MKKMVILTICTITILGSFNNTVVSAQDNTIITNSDGNSNIKKVKNIKPSDIKNNDKIDSTTKNIYNNYEQILANTRKYKEKINIQQYLPSNPEVKVTNN